MNSNHISKGDITSSWCFSSQAWLEDKTINKRLSKTEFFFARSAFEYLSYKDNALSDYSYVYENIEGDIISQVYTRRSVRFFNKTKKISYDDFLVLVVDIRKRLKICEHFKVYLCVFNVDGLDEGLYEVSSSFTGVKLCNVDRSKVCSLISGMTTSMTSNITIFLSVDWDIFKVKGGSSYRHILIEAGAIMQSMILNVTKLGLFSVPTPAIKDSETKEYLNIKSNVEFPLYSLAIGYKHD